VLQPQILDLNTLVADMDKMLRRLIGADIDLLTSPGSTGLVRADPGQIELVLLNLVVNARDAMPRGGKITIETADVHLDATYVRDRAGLVSGPYVMMSVSDTGAGIDPEAKPHIFEPFFTTKEVGKGTGLGLSTVYGIVKQSDGHIEVYSERGRGATFKIYLPRSTAAAGEAGAAPSVARPLGGTESILLVEDEDLVRAVIRKTLEVHGYRVLEACDGADALRMLEDTSPEVDLIVTDVMMPQLTGPELARRAARRFQGLKVLFVSGYTDKAVIHHGLLGPGTAFMQKPFAPDALARKVREVLDGDPAKAA
jgi:CheY-like chemotaxis protein